MRTFKCWVDLDEPIDLDDPVLISCDEPYDAAIRYAKLHDLICNPGDMVTIIVNDGDTWATCVVALDFKVTCSAFVAKETLTNPRRGLAPGR